MAKKKRSGWVADPQQVLAARGGFQLAQLDPNSTPGFRGKKKRAERVLKRDGSDLGELQELLWANGVKGDHRSVLLVLQGMDTAGKGGIVRHVVGQVDPQGVRISSFKKPTEEELAHDFLWRIEKRVPAPGFIGVFDRSHYEDVLIGRVRELAPAKEIERRYEAINDFEQRLIDSGTSIIKVALHISKAEQLSRLSARLDDPTKYWKYSSNDLAERGLWDQYQEAFQLVFERTSTEAAPWYVVPANNKWYARIAVQQLLISALEDLDLQWPAADFDPKEQLRLLKES